MSKEPGYVYILTNPSFKEDWIKIGKSSRPVGMRSKELDNTSMPLPFEVYATMKTVKYNEVEKVVHHYIERFSNLRIRNNREFFNVSPEIALEIFYEFATILDDAEIVDFHKQAVMGNAEAKKDQKTPKRNESRVWIIPANKRYFDLEGCRKEYGEVYWSQYFNYQTGDTGYIYCSSPESAIRYKFTITGHDLPYEQTMERERKFFTSPEDFDESINHNRFVLLRIEGETESSHLGLANLLEHGLKMAPRGALWLSHRDYTELREYIEDNF